MAKRYQGWTNYVTWNVATQIQNDEALAEYWQEVASWAFDLADDANEIDDQKYEAAGELAARLENEYRPSASDQRTPSPGGDGRVNFREIADELISDLSM
jgi:hypothetical protein